MKDDQLVVRGSLSVATDDGQPAADLAPAAAARWRTQTSAAGLTWGMTLDGDALVMATTRHVPIEGAAILEIGPGYGRFLRSLLKVQGPKSNVQSLVDPTLDFGAGTLDFSHYVGLDISAHWTCELAKEFADHRHIKFVHGSAEEADKLLNGRQFDVIVSFLTWKHFYPDFSAVARCCYKLLTPGGHLIFDLPETEIAWPLRPDDVDGSFNRDTGTFTRHYSRPQIESLLAAASFTIRAFDDIEHAPGKRRLLIVSSPLSVASCNGPLTTDHGPTS